MLKHSFECFFLSQNKFPNASDEEYAACIGRLVYYRYINPAIMYAPTNASTLPRSHAYP